MGAKIMGAILTKVGAWLGAKWVHILVIVFLALISIGISIGVPYKLFVKDTTKTTATYTAPVTQSTQEVKVYPGGCAIFKPNIKK